MSNDNQHEEFYDRSDERQKIPDQINAHKGLRQIIMFLLKFCSIVWTRSAQPRLYQSFAGVVVFYHIHPKNISNHFFQVINLQR